MDLDDFFPTRREALLCPDQYIDEVAIERALKGDGSVLESMTLPERFALLTAVAEKYDPEDRTHQWGEGTHAPPRIQNVLIKNLAESWGMDYQYLFQKVENKRRRMYEQAYRKGRHEA